MGLIFLLILFDNKCYKVVILMYYYNISKVMKDG